MKISKHKLEQIIREETTNALKEDWPPVQELQADPAYDSSAAEGQYPEQGPQDEAQYEVMVQMGRFLAKLANEGHDELANEFDQILVQARDAGMVGKKGQ